MTLRAMWQWLTNLFARKIPVAAETPLDSAPIPGSPVTAPLDVPEISLDLPGLDGNWTIRPRVVSGRPDRIYFYVTGKGGGKHLAQLDAKVVKAFIGAGDQVGLRNAIMAQVQDKQALAMRTAEALAK